MIFINNEFLLGIFAALATTYLGSRAQLAYNLNRIRIAIYCYLDNLFAIKLNIYQKQCELMIPLVNHYGNSNNISYKYDQLPVLNTEYLNAYDLTTLRKVLQDENIFKVFISFKSSINYLQTPSPYELFLEFNNKMNTHRETEHEDESIENFLACPVVISLKHNLIASLEYKSEAAKEMKKEIEVVIRYLGGCPFIWLFFLMPLGERKQDTCCLHKHRTINIFYTQAHFARLK